MLRSGKSRPILLGRHFIFRETFRADGDVTSPLTRELMDSSKITLALTSGRKVISFGKREALVEISGKEATDAYWESVDSISRTLVWNYPLFT
jgi:hypothetical protein